MPTFTTNIQLGRSREDEKLIRNAYLNEQLAAGLLIADDPTNFDIQSANGIRNWTTEDAANAYVDWCNKTFDPPPISSEVIINN